VSFDKMPVATANWGVSAACLMAAESIASAIAWRTRQRLGDRAVLDERQAERDAGVGAADDGEATALQRGDVLRLDVVETAGAARAQP
jgi:hypothetical protein